MAGCALKAPEPKDLDIEADASVHVVFRDCGENFERVLCPHCRNEIDVGLWQDLMDSDYSEADGFRLNAVPMRCCGQPSSVNDLVYEWPQGFSRFALTVADAGAEIAEGLLAKLESVLGCKLRIIRQVY